MADNSHTPAPVDPGALQSAHTLWSGFTKYTAWVVIGVVAILALMAFFLV